MAEEAFGGDTKGEDAPLQEAAAALLRRVEFLREAGLREIFVPRAAAAEDAVMPGPATASPCPSCALGGTELPRVAGEGAKRPVVLFVGGAPSKADADGGRPFTGEEGGLLLKIIGAMGLKENEFHLTRAVKCVPPDAHSGKEAARSCTALLDDEISRLAPKVIVALGPLACAALCGGKDLDAAAGKEFEYNGYKVVPTFGPAEIIKRPELKSAVWRHVKMVMSSLGRPVAS